MQVLCLACSVCFVQLIAQEQVINWHVSSCRYLANIRTCTPSERAGGFEPHIACQRALMDAMSGLFYFPAVHKPSPETSLAPTSHGPTPSPMYIS